MPARPGEPAEGARLSAACRRPSSACTAIPKLFGGYPFHADILTELENASVRPKTPLYQVVSINISHLVSPPATISPRSTEKQMVSQINNALQSKGLIP